MTSLTQVIAEFIADAKLDGIAEEVLDSSAKALADTFAVTMAGSRSECREPLLRYLGRAGLMGTSAVLGGGLRLPPEAAALVNGTFGAALDFDDVMPMMPGHPSAIVLATALSELDRRPVSGHALVEAHVIAVEVGAKLGLGLTLGHYERGFHGTGTLGVFVGVAALARLRRTPMGLVRTALGIASSMSSGLKCNFGTMTKAMHTGWAAQHAVQALDLAESGITACDGAFEVDNGYFRTYGVGASDPALTAATLGRTWALSDPGLGLRRFACYNGLQRAMDAVLALHKDMPLSTSSVESVQCLVPPGSISGAVHPRPRTGAEGKFSMHYVIAAGVMDGAYGLATFTDEAVSRPGILRLMERIEVRESPDCAWQHPEADGTELGGTAGFVQVSVELESGESHTRRVSVSAGHPLRPLSWQELSTKMIDCLRFAGLGSEEAVERARDLCAVRTSHDIRGLVETLSAASSRD